MTITNDEVYLLNNKMGSIARKCQLGTLIQNAESVVAAEIALADGALLVGNASGVAVGIVPTGDVTISNAGVTAIGSAKVTLAMLASAVAPSHVVKYAGKFTTLGGDATEVITVTGLAATDVVVVTVQTAGGTPRSVVDAIPTTNTLTVTMSGDPSTDHILSYVAWRATA